jgi:hypothetical protein
MQIYYFNLTRLIELLHWESETEMERAYPELFEGKF